MINSSSVLAIIPARENSKRLKRKNILKFNNKPLLASSIISAKKSKYIDRLILSTESKFIKNIKKKFRCEVPFLRPKHLSKDNISASEVVYYVVKRLKKKYDIILLLQPTSPLRTIQDIDSAIKFFIKINAKSLVSVSKHPKANKNLVKINKKLLIRRTSKNNKNFFFMNGAIYLAKRNFFLKRRKFFHKNETVAYKMPYSRSIDIDTEEDFNKVIKIFKNENYSSSRY